MAFQYSFRPIRTARHAPLIQPEQNHARSQTHDQIGHAQAPQAHARRVHGGDFVVAGMIRERVKQRKQQHDRQHRHQKFRRHRNGILDDIQQMQFAFLHFLQLGEQVVGNPENQKAAEAIRQRREQFAEQISVEQPHCVVRVSGASRREQVLSSAQN